MMNVLIARKSPPACCDDGAGPVKRTMQPALCAVSGVHHRRPAMDSTVLASADELMRDAAVDALGGSTMPASARGVQRRLPQRIRISLSAPRLSPVTPLLSYRL